MIDEALSWAMAHPLLFVAVLCIIAGGAALLIVPQVRRQMHLTHPRC